MSTRLVSMKSQKQIPSSKGTKSPLYRQLSLHPQSHNKIDSEPTSVEGVIVRQKECKTILNKTSISDYSLNCYVGCAHACVYCYARFMQRFHPHSEPWGRFVDIKVNAVDVLKRQLRLAQPGQVFVSSACDGWQPVEAQWQLTRQCCDLLLKSGFRLNILTKSRLILRDLDILSRPDVSVGVTITTLDDNLRCLWEPKSAGVQERLQVISRAHSTGAKTSIMFGPLLPFLSDSIGSISQMFEVAAALSVDAIRVDALNPRPKVWSSVAALLQQRFPDLLNRYRLMMFDNTTRRAYLDELRNRIALAGKRSSLTNRVLECF